METGIPVERLVGSAPIFLRAIDPIPAAAQSEAAVLISGETGTGKELVAHAIHYLSVRAALPFVAVNCGSFSDPLLEDALFGHERGAFTGAEKRKQGLVAAADKGTLFLDEVDALSAKAQVDLLRVVQDKKFRPLGSSVEQQVNVRIVAATNTRLDQLLASGGFRLDLYYRLCVFSIQLPALRERKEDILALASHFLRKHAPPEKGPLKLSRLARAALLAWEWPGNVRELESAIIRSIYLCRFGTVEPEDLRLPVDGTTAAGTTAEELSLLRPFQAMKREVIEAFEKNYLHRLMSQHAGNVTQAARAAGKERRELGKLLKKYRLDPKAFRLRGSEASA